MRGASIIACATTSGFELVQTSWRSLLKLPSMQDYSFMLSRHEACGVSSVHNCHKSYAKRATRAPRTSTPLKAGRRSVMSSPWSTQSQMKPPWQRGLHSNRSQ